MTIFINNAGCSDSVCVIFCKYLFYLYICIISPDDGAKKMQMLKKIFALYRDGFREMRVGRILWIIILVKLFIMFAVLKLFFFRDPMAGMNDEERAMTVMEKLTGNQTLNK